MHFVWISGSSPCPVTDCATRLAITVEESSSGRKLGIVHNFELACVGIELWISNAHNLSREFVTNFAPMA